eukprot:sb/3464820/
MLTGGVDLLNRIKCKLPNVKNGTFYIEDGLEAMQDVLYGTVLKPNCDDGFQRQGPDTVTCGADGTFGAADFECVVLSKPEFDLKNCVSTKTPPTSDLNVVTCPTLDSNFGTMECDVTKDPVECTYFCPTDNYFELDDVIVSKQTVTCDSSTAKWSHMSSSNPLGTFPQCSVTDTATYITMTTKLGFSGATTCPSSDANIKSGLQTTFQSSSSSGYACMKSSCSISEASCSVTGSVVYFTFTVNQTSGDLSSDAVIAAFQTQLSSDVQEKKLAVTVATGGTRRKRATSFTSNGEQSSTTYSSLCSAGSGSVGSKCLKCPTGTYESDGSCEFCAKGSYSSTAGSTSCTACTGSLTTITTGADSITDCIKMCTVKKVSGDAVTSLKTGSELAMNQKVSYTCKNDEEGKFNVACDVTGDELSVSCPSKCRICSSRQDPHP